MKNILILLVLLLAADFAYGQKTGAVYIITTSISTPNQTGVLRRSSLDKPTNPLYNTNPIHFWMRKQDKSVEVWFGHYDYNLTELAKKRKVMTSDRMEIITKPKSFLNTIHPADIDQMIETKSKEEIWKWANSLKINRSPIYLIDRNDFTADSIKLIEVDTSNNAPDNPVRM